MKARKYLYIIVEDDGTKDMEHFGIMDKRYAGNPKWYFTLPLIDSVRKWLWSITVDLIIGDGSNNRFALRTDGTLEARRFGKVADLVASTSTTALAVGDAAMVYDIDVQANTDLTTTGTALKGQGMTLLLKAGVTPYTITFNATYFNVTSVVQTASKTTVIELIFNGAKFIEKSRNTEP